MTKLSYKKKFLINNLNESKIFGSNLNYDIILSEIRNKGYYIFENKISDNIINDIITFSKKVECEIYDDQGNFVSKKFREDENIISSKYEISSVKIIDNDNIKNLISDHAFLKIANLYFQNQPKLTDVSMWWSICKEF